MCQKNEMTTDVFEQLAAALDRLPNGFPRTPSGVEILILKRIFSPEEAALAGQLSGAPETLDEISARLSLPAGEARKALFKLARRGMVWLDTQGKKPRFRLAPFVVGFLEEQWELMDHELAHLVEAYLAGGGAAGIMKPQPALNRVVPAQRAVKTEWVLPYDDVRTLLLSARSFQVRDCICRRQQDQLGGRKCDFPLQVCLYFSERESGGVSGTISQEEALALLARTEEVGLVHTVSNVMKGVGFVCNCCGCCCGILRGITDWGIENSVAHANYFAVIDPETCTDCGDCIRRCQVNAVSAGDGIAMVDRARCIGCGLCVTGCPSNAARLERKPEAEIIHPPEDYAAWERERRNNRQ